MASIIKYEGITPKVYVKNITLTPHRLPNSIVDNRWDATSEGVTIVLDMCIKQQITASGLSEYHNLFALMQNIDIFVVQSFTPSQSGRFGNTVAPSNLGSVLANPRARVQSFLENSRSMTQTLNALTAMTDKVQFAKINLLETRSTVLDSGDPRAYVSASLLEIPFQVSFFIPDANPTSLEYRVFTHIDAEKAITQGGELASPDPAHLYSLNQTGGSVTYQSVIRGSKVNERAFVYLDGAGNQWLGEVHQMPDTDQIMKGAVHGDYEGANALLVKREVYNSKINDLRPLALPPVEDRFDGGDVYYDAHEYQRQFRMRRLTARAYGMRNIREGAGSLREAMIERLMSPTNRRTEYGGARFDSELILTPTLGRRCNFLFTVDWAQIVKYQSRLAKFYTSFPQSSFSRVLSSSLIRSMKLFRRRMTDMPIGVDKMGNSAHKIMDENEIPTLVASYSETIQPQGEGALVSTNQLSEVNIDWSSSGGFYYRSFGGTDTDIANVNYGKYQYYLEVEVVDGIDSIMEGHKSELEESLRFMKQFLERASIPAYVPGYNGTDYRNATPDQLAEYLNAGARLQGSYDYDRLRYTEGYLEDIERETSGLAAAVRRYLAAYRIIYGSADSGDNNMLYNIINPRRGASPESIQNFIMCLQSLLSKIEDILQYNTARGKDEGAKTPAPSRYPEKNVFKFDIQFDEIYDASVVNNPSVTYFSDYTNVNNGLKIVKMEDRVREEYVQFFGDSQALVNGSSADIRKNGIKLTPNEYHISSPEIMKNSTFANKNDFGVGYRTNSPEIGFISTAGNFGNAEDTRLRALVAPMYTGGQNMASNVNLSHRTPFVPSRDMVFSGDEASSFRINSQAMLQTRTNFLQNLESTYINIDKIHDLGVTLETPSYLRDTTWLQDFDDADEFISDPKILASSVSGSGENLCLNDRIARRSLPTSPRNLMASPASKFVNLLSRRLTTNIDGVYESENVGTIRGVQERLESIRETNPYIYDTVPMQIRSIVRAGVETPGVLANGEVSPFLFGMMASVEEKVDTSFGKSGTKSGEGDFKPVRNALAGSRTSSTTPSTGKKYKLCRLAPYENREAGISRAKSMSSTVVMDEYFLVEVG